VPSQPFTDRINNLRSDRGWRYADLEAHSDRARSSAWFNNLINQGAQAVGPPTQETWSGLARLCDTSTEDVRRMIAEEWCGVRSAPEVTARVASLAPDLDALPDADAALVAALVHRLALGAQGPTS
jgi:hypothetical protein